MLNEHAGGVKHALAFQMVMASSRRGPDLLGLQNWADRPRNGQVAGGQQQTMETVAGASYTIIFMEGADVVQAGVGARVRKEHQAASI
jgi:hypothetical protein